MGMVIDISRRRRPKSPRRRSVFLACRFADRELVDGLIRLLKHEGFEVVTGESVNGYVSDSILERIKASSLFLALMTPDEPKMDETFTTSPWILQETGAALALGKPPVIMVHEQVTRIGGLPGDLQLIRFTDKGFLNAALNAVEQLEAYCAPISKGT